MRVIFWVSGTTGEACVVTFVSDSPVAGKVSSFKLYQNNKDKEVNKTSFHRSIEPENKQVSFFKH